MTIEIVDLPIENGGSFFSFLYVYQRVNLDFPMVFPMVFPCSYGFPMVFPMVFPCSYCFPMAFPIVFPCSYCFPMVFPYPQVLARGLGGCIVDPTRWVYIQLPAVST